MYTEVYIGAMVACPGEIPSTVTFVRLCLHFRLVDAAILCSSCPLTCALPWLQSVMLPKPWFPSVRPCLTFRSTCVFSWCYCIRLLLSVPGHSACAKHVLRLFGRALHILSLNLMCLIMFSAHPAVPYLADPAAMSESSSPSIPIVDIAVDAIIKLVDADGNVVEEKEGVAMEF